MSETSTYPLRLPKSLKDEVSKVAKRDGTSINQFIAIAVAEKIQGIDSSWVCFFPLTPGDVTYP